MVAAISLLRNLRRAGRSLTLAAALAAATAAAHADSGWVGAAGIGWPQTPGWFVMPGSEIGVQRLPRWNSTISLHIPSAFVGAPQAGNFAARPAAFGSEAGATIGYVFRDDALPPWLGQRLRVGLTGTAVNLADTVNQSFTTPAAGSAIQYIGVNGRNIATALIAPLPLTETLHVLREGFDLNLRVASDFPLGPDLTLTPSVAVYGGLTRDSYDYRYTLTTTGLTVFHFLIEEKLRSRAVGSELSLGLTWQANSYLSLSASGRAGAVWTHTRLEGSDCFFFPPSVPTCSGNLTGTVTDSRSRVGFRGGAALSGALDMRLGILTLGGFFLYDSAIPGVVNPTAAATTTTAGQVAAPAHIKFSGGYRYGGVVSLRVPLIGL